MYLPVSSAHLQALSSVNTIVNSFGGACFPSQPTQTLEQLATLHQASFNKQLKTHLFQLAYYPLCYNVILMFYFKYFIWYTATHCTGYGNCHSLLWIWLLNIIMLYTFVIILYKQFGNKVTKVGVAVELTISIRLWANETLASGQLHAQIW